jgi:hypothetical protein
MEARPGDLVKGDSGKLSLMRTMSLLVVVSVMSVFIAHNIIAMIQLKGFVSIGAEEAMLVAGVLASKAAQRFGEGRKPMDAPGTDDLPYNKGE